jgi:peroxiredoxin
MKQSAMVGGGSSAPDFEAVDTDGNRVRLSQFWKGDPLVVVFLRHLGCTFCRTQVIELRNRYGEFREKGSEVVCVAMGSPKVGQAFRLMFHLPFPMLMTADTDTSAYDLYGLPKGRLSQLLGFGSWIGGLRAIPILGRRIVGRLIGDGTQLAGTFIIDQSGTIRLAYRSKSASDNPPSSLLLKTIADLQEGGNPLEDIGSEQAAASAG